MLTTERSLEPKKIFSWCKTIWRYSQAVHSRQL